MGLRVAHDSLFDLLPADLVLRLDQCNKIGRRDRERANCRQHVLERDEADVDGDEVRRLGKAVEVPDIGFLQRNDLGPRAQARMQLAASDVDGVDAPGAALEQHLREAAGRRADVEADAPARIETEMVERGRELLPAPRHIRMRGRGAQNRVGGNLLGRLAHRPVIGDDQAGFDRGLRLGAAVEQPALDQQPVGAQARGHRHLPAVRRERSGTAGIPAPLNKKHRPSHPSRQTMRRFAKLLPALLGIALSTSAAGAGTRYPGLQLDERMSIRAPVHVSIFPKGLFVPAGSPHGERSAVPHAGRSRRILHIHIGRRQGRVAAKLSAKQPQGPAPRPGI